MHETRYINENGICNYSKITEDDGSSQSVKYDGNIPQIYPLRSRDSLTIVPINNILQSCTILYNFIS